MGQQANWSNLGKNETNAIAVEIEWKWYVWKKKKLTELDDWSDEAEEEKLWLMQYVYSGISKEWHLELRQGF